MGRPGNKATWNVQARLELQPSRWHASGSLATLLSEGSCEPCVLQSWRPVPSCLCCTGDTGLSHWGTCLVKWLLEISALQFQSRWNKHIDYSDIMACSYKVMYTVVYLGGNKKWYANDLYGPITTRVTALNTHSVVRRWNKGRANSLASFPGLPCFCSSVCIIHRSGRAHKENNKKTGILYWMQTGKKKKKRPGNKATKS